MLSIIVAQSKNRVIGKAGDLPWHLPDDLARFKQLTSGHTVIMGHKTLESIVARIGMPLPNRRNIVLSRDRDYSPDNVEVAHSVDEALKLTKKETETFVIGGAQIYELFLPYAERIYITQVGADIDGDTYFPKLGSQWYETSREHHAKDERHAYNFDFLVFEKK